MKADLEIQQIWLEVLRKASRPGDIHCRKLGEGYYAVALLPVGGPKARTLSPAAHHAALRSKIPYFDRTRAVSLNFDRDSQFSDIGSLRTRAGDLAAEVETGVRLAFAVVDPEAFGECVALELRAAGWQVESSKEELRVTDGLFVQQVNLLRALVRMVLSRSGIAEARRALRKEVARGFTLYRRLFRQFVERFQEVKPAVVGHYFAAYPDGSCMVAGWDYWQVSGKAPAEAEQVLGEAMKEFKTFLKTPSGDWFPGILACERGDCRRLR